MRFLRAKNYPEIYFAGISHAIEAHSFSAGIEPQTAEARVVQDADRLDAVGAIGIARCFAVSSLIHSQFYDPADPLAVSRPLDDGRFALDHFAVKLFKIIPTMKTEAGRREGQKRLETMQLFLREFSREIGS